MEEDLRALRTRFQRDVTSGGLALGITSQSVQIGTCSLKAPRGEAVGGGRLISIPRCAFIFVCAKHHPKTEQYCTGTVGRAAHTVSTCQRTMSRDEAYVDLDALCEMLSMHACCPRLSACDVLTRLFLLRRMQLARWLLGIIHLHRCVATRLGRNRRDAT